MRGITMRRFSVLLFSVLLFVCVLSSRFALADTAPLHLVFYSNTAGQAANVRVVITDNTGAVLVAATNNPSGSAAFAESAVIPGEYYAPLVVTYTPANLPLRGEFYLTGSSPLVSGATIYLTERGAEIAGGYTSGLPGVITAKTNLIATNAGNSPNEITAQGSVSALLLSLATYQSVLTAGSTASVLSTALVGTADLTGSKVVFTTGVNKGVTRTITSMNSGTGAINLLTATPSTPGATDAFSVVQGSKALEQFLAALGTDNKPFLTATDTQAQAEAGTALTAYGAATGTQVAALPAANATAVWGATTKTVTGGTVTTVTNAVVLPTTPPTGYGGSTGDTPGTTSLLAKIGTPAGASIAADVAAVKSDTGSLVTNVASLPAANATAVWGSTTRALTDKANFALVSTEYANIAAVTSTYGFDGPPAGTILTLTITRNGSSQPVLTWTADPAATLYKVYRSTDGANYTVIATPATGTLTYTDTARPAGATVYYHITSTH